MADSYNDPQFKVSLKKLPTIQTRIRTPAPEMRER